MSKNGKMKAGDVFILILLVVLAIVLSPIWIPLITVLYVKETLIRWRFKRYLAKNEGAKFFCYTNRQTSLEYVRTNILPYLPEGVEIIYMSAKAKVNLGDETEFQNRIAWQMKTIPGGFPYISKVVDGQLMTRSINNRLYSAITRKADADAIVNTVKKFFSDS